jgi:Flp pilus assembly protein TadG
MASSHNVSSRHFRTQRRGAVVVLMAFMLMVLVAMLAFALDIGYICRVQTELQNAADAAALSGAHEALRAAARNDADTSVLANITIQSAQQAAQQIGSSNQAGGVELTLPTADIIVGYEASPGPQPIEGWSGGDPVPNCVQVTVRRDGVANGALPLIFGPLLGKQYSDLSATATAAYNPGRFKVTGFKRTSDERYSGLLPITIHIDTWNAFINSGLSPDGSRHDDYSLEMVLPNSTLQPPNNIRNGGDDTPELVGVYPSKAAPGDFSLVQFNPNVSQAIRYTSNWILHGPSPADLDSFGPQGLQATPGSPLTLQAGTGWKSSLVTDLQAIIGQARAIPLYGSNSGTGDNGEFQIVGFAGVTVMHASGSGSHVKIAFQPSILIDPTATTSTTTFTTTEFVYPQVPVVLVR